MDRAVTKKRPETTLSENDVIPSSGEVNIVGKKHGS